jgi:hypothetical protein
MPDAEQSDTAGPSAPDLTAPEPSAAPQRRAPRAPKGLIPDKAERDRFCNTGLETVVKALEELCRRGGVDFMLCTLRTDAAACQQALSHASKHLEGLLDDVQPRTALPAHKRAAEGARRLAFARAADFGSLDIKLMRHAVDALLEELMSVRKGTLPYSGSGEAITPEDVHDMHDWFPAAAIGSWRSPATWPRAELTAVAVAAVRTPDFIRVTLPRLLRKLRLRTKDDAELECALQHLHRTPAQPASVVAEQAQQADIPEAQRQLAPMPPEIVDGAPSSPAIQILACSCMNRASRSLKHVYSVSTAKEPVSLDPTCCMSCFSSVCMMSDGTQIYVERCLP